MESSSFRQCDSIKIFAFLFQLSQLNCNFMEGSMSQLVKDGILMLNMHYFFILTFMLPWRWLV